MGAALARNGHRFGLPGISETSRQREVLSFKHHREVAALPETAANRWQAPWRYAQPITGTWASTYLAARKLWFDDLDGEVLRFSLGRIRKNPEGEFERHPALLAALRDVRTGEQCGIINIYLGPDGTDRIRDDKGKTVTGRARGAVVMLSPFDEPTMGLTVCEGVETGLAIYQSGLWPVWACGGAGRSRRSPCLAASRFDDRGGRDEPGQLAAERSRGDGGRPARRFG